VAKRRNSSTPNIPEETLRRAREQSQEGNETEQPRQTNYAYSKSRAERRADLRAAESGVPRRRIQTDESGRRTRRVDEITSEYVAQMLANPTKVVTEEQLHQQYGYVLADLRNMFILAGALFAALIVLAVIFVR
jgi:hypothetical protein